MKDGKREDAAAHGLLFTVPDPDAPDLSMDDIITEAARAVGPLAVEDGAA